MYFIFPFLLQSLCLALQSTISIESLLLLPPSSIISQNQPTNLSEQECSPIIESKFINYEFSCIDGCVVLSSTESITIPSLILADIADPLTSCILFNNIKSIEIDTFILQNLVIEINQPNTSSFIKFSNIDSLKISNFSISNLSNKDDSFVSLAVFIDSSVLSQEFQTVQISSSRINQDPNLLINLFSYILQSNANMIKVKTLQIIECYDQINFSNISQIQIDQIIFQQDLTPLSPSIHQVFLDKITLKLSAALSISVNSIDILDKRDSKKIVNSDILFEIICLDEQQSSITINEITRNASLIQNKQIQSEQVTFFIFMELVKSNKQYLKPNLSIQSIQSSMIMNQQVQPNPLNPQLFISITFYKTVLIGSIILKDYTKQLLEFNAVDEISIGSLYATSNSLQNISMADQQLISVRSSNNVSLSNIILQSIVISTTSYFIISDAKSFSINQLLIENSFFISSQFLIAVDSVSVAIYNTMIRDLVLLLSKASQIYTASVFAFTNNNYVEFKNFTMNSLHQPINQIEGYSTDSFIFSQNVIISNNCTTHALTDIHINLEGQQLGFFESIDFKHEINVSNSTFDHCFSSLGGGCFSFNINSNEISMLEPKLYLSNVTFTHASSGYFGGAIFGSEIVSAINVHFESCSSLIGGALFLKGNSDLNALANITFANNFADIVNPDICYGIDQIKEGQVLEYNPSLQDTPLYLFSIGQYSESIQFYPGILYVLELELLIDGIWYSKLPSQRTTYNGFNSELINNGNLFPFVKEAKLLESQVITNETNFYILYDPTNSNLYGGIEQAMMFTFSAFVTVQFWLQQTSNAKCKDGMEKILFSNGYTHICQYCGFSKAIYPSSSVCQTCDVTYFKTCYSNQTELNKGYWRSNYTINTTLIETCSISMQSCNGGFGIGNSLCYEGHIGPQCLNCDIRGEYWGESYSTQGVYTCSKCSGIQSNEIKIIIGLVLISLSLMVIIKGNFKATKNQIYADYLAKIKLIYIGSSLSRLQQMSTCLKVLLFNLFFANLVNQFTSIRVWKSLSETSVILNSPLVTQLFSVDCFLVKSFSSDLNLGFANLMISIATPGIIFTAHLLIGIVIILVNKQQKKRTQTQFMTHSLVLSFTYLYLIVFYPFIFQLCLKSFYCIQLEGSRTFSQIDLSLECDHPSDTSLQDIHALATPVLLLIIICTPLFIVVFLYKRKSKLRTVRMMLSLGFLYREYKDQFFLWEFARIILKSVCVFTQVSLIGNPELYGTVIALLLIIYLILLIFQQPFQGKLFNRLEQISVSIQILSIQSAVLYSDQQLNHVRDSTMIKILFIGSQILNVIFVVCLSLLIVFSFLQKQLIKLHRKWRIPFAERFLPLYSSQLRINFQKLRCLVQRMKEEMYVGKEEDQQSLLQLEQKYEVYDEPNKDHDQIENIDKQQLNLSEINTESINPLGLLKNDSS